MAIIKHREIPKPRYQNTIVCHKCCSEFNPDTKWVRGYYKGTSDDLEIISHILPGNCPFCGASYGPELPSTEK